MPYIKQEDRDALAGGRMVLSVGELNYTLTMTVLDHIKDGGRQQDLVAKLVRIATDYMARQGLNYDIINDIIGAFTCAAFELSRRCRSCGIEVRLMHEAAVDFYAQFAARYEEEKILENGDLPYAGN